MFGLSTLAHSAAFKSNMSTPPASLGPKKDLTTFVFFLAERDGLCDEGSVRVFVEVRRALDLPEGGSGVVAGVDDSGRDTSGEQEADGEAEPRR